MGGAVVVALAAIALVAPAPGASNADADSAERSPARINFGHSVDDRDLVARRVGPEGGPRTVLVVGEIHGNEEAGRAVVRSIRGDSGKARGLTIWTVASVNPDGHETDTRTNAHGVDLNRNFPVGWSGAAGPGSGDYGGPNALSEPESRAYRDLVRRLKPDVTVLFHQPWGAVLAPCMGPIPIQQRYSQISGLELDRCRGEELPGTMTKWQNRRSGTAFVVELAEGNLSNGAVRRHARAIRDLAG